MSDRPRPYGFNSTLRTGGPLRSYNPEKRAKRERQGEVYGPHHSYVKRLPCMLRGDSRHVCTFPLDSHHVKHVGNGGVDADNCVPLCAGAHTLDDKLSVHVMGTESFERYWKVDLRTTAAEIWAASPHNPTNQVAKQFDAELEAEQLKCERGIHPSGARQIRGGRLYCTACNRPVRP